VFYAGDLVGSEGVCRGAGIKRGEGNTKRTGVLRLAKVVVWAGEVGHWERPEHPDRAKEAGGT